MPPREIVPRRPRGRVVAADSVHPDPDNTNEHTRDSIASVAASLARFGQRKPIVVRPDGAIVAGEGTWLALRELGQERVWVVDTDDLTDEEAEAYSIADNATAEHRVWKAELLRHRLQHLGERGIEAAEMGFTPGQLSRVMNALRTAPSVDEDPERDASRAGDGEAGGPDAPPEGEGAGATAKPKRDYGSTGRQKTNLTAAEEAMRTWSVEPGQRWSLGRHLVACGDAKSPDLVAQLLAGVEGHLVLTDPPYCSGAFQESGKAAGTWGKIASDSLSSRGYQALIAAVLAASRPRAAYIFTDWRMWTPLFDVVEAAGLPVRSMIVWDKGSPGLGGLWRPQHEIVLYSCRDGQEREEGMAATGNVFRFPRTGNEHHYTEKPVELLAEILKNDESSPRRRSDVHDPFLGSGSTLLACEHRGRRCVGTDVEPLCVAVALQRWHEMTGEQPRRL